MESVSQQQMRLLRLIRDQQIEQASDADLGMLAAIVDAGHAQGTVARGSQNEPIGVMAPELTLSGYDLLSRLESQAQANTLTGQLKIDRWGIYRWFAALIIGSLVALLLGWWFKFWLPDPEVPAPLHVPSKSAPARATKP